jgi:acyl-CoA thioester hydrolase
MARCTLRVIYGDTDQMGVVYYANYLRFFEAGRNELCRVCDIPYRELEDRGYMLPVTEVAARYRRPARYDDLVIVETTLGRLGRAQLRFEYQVRREADGELLCTGHTVHACLGEGGRPTRLPRDLVERFQQTLEP